MTEPRRTPPGSLRLRPAPEGLPDPTLQPPTTAEVGDPFAALRIVSLVARIERGAPVLVDDLVDHLNATWLDWLFPKVVVIDTLVALQSNWMADYRNASGIVLEEHPYGAVVTIEESPRVDPWLVRQAARLAGECRERLLAFSRLDRHTGDG